MNRATRALRVVLLVAVVLAATRVGAEPSVGDNVPATLSSDEASVCGDGIVGAGEECDDGNLADGDCCTSQCAVPASCDDGNACTESDRCDAGTCLGDAIECGPCRTCDPEMGCHIAMVESCRHSRVPWANRFEIRRGADPDSDRLTWRWRRGEWTPAAALGDPFTADGYTLCVFGRRGRDLLVAIGAPAGGTCDGRACWSRRGPNGIRYRDWAARGGIATLRVDAKPDGKSKVVAEGKGPLLNLPPLPLPVPLTVQLQAGDGACWEATYEADDVLQDALQLRARGPRP